MKKVLVFLLLFISIFFHIEKSFSDFEGTTGGSSGAGSSSNCNYEGVGDVGQALDGCLQGTQLVDGSDVAVDSGGFARKIITWVDNISIYLGVLAVGLIVYGAFIMTISAGEDEKITQAKNNIKWGVIGFVALISAAGIINLIVSIMYSL